MSDDVAIPASSATEPAEFGFSDLFARASRTLRRSGMAVALVAVALGALAVGQFRGQAGVPGLADLSAQELTQLIANLSTRNEQLRDEAATAEARAVALQAASGEGAAGLTALREDLLRIRMWSGTLAVTGPGVTITIGGPISARAMGALLNEIRNAGAEAISVGGVRVVVGTVVAGPAGALSVENSALGGSIEIRVIGSPQLLVGSLTRPGGIVAQLAATDPDARISVTPSDVVRVPATVRDLTPSHARPRL